MAELPIDFSEAKAEKEGLITPRAVIEDLLSKIDSVESVIFVTKMKETNEIKVGFSNGSTLELIGLLECAKVEVMESIYEEE